MMRPNPASDVIVFLTKPSIFTLIYWLLLIGAALIAAQVWRRDSTQRTGTAIGILILRFFTGTMWWQQSLWKIPPQEGGLIYWMGQEVAHAAIPFQSFLIKTVVLPHILIFGPLVYAVEVAIGVSMMLGLFTRLGALLGIAMGVNLWLGLYSAPGEWPWTYFFLIIIMCLFWLTPPGRVLGFDALKAEQLPVTTGRRFYLA
ncbi:MAG: DoxX family membrane protein [Acidocella sp.]|nr:DoxX family membrane protein [Acidocella sp.]